MRAAAKVVAALKATATGQSASIAMTEPRVHQNARTAHEYAGERKRLGAPSPKLIQYKQRSDDGNEIRALANRDSMPKRSHGLPIA